MVPGYFYAEAQEVTFLQALSLVVNWKSDLLA